MAPGGPWAGPGRSGRSGDEQEARETAKEVKRGVWQNRDAPAITRGQIHLYINLSSLRPKCTVLYSTVIAMASI